MLIYVKTVLEVKSLPATIPEECEGIITLKWEGLSAEFSFSVTGRRAMTTFTEDTGFYRYWLRTRENYSAVFRIAERTIVELNKDADNSRLSIGGKNLLQLLLKVAVLTIQYFRDPGRAMDLLHGSGYLNCRLRDNGAEIENQYDYDPTTLKLMQEAIAEKLK